jgi:hypothetical protein
MVALTFLQRRQDASYDVLRRRMIRETELALLYGVTHSPSVPRIPTIEVGTARFDPAFARQWWDHVLSLEAAAGLPQL